MFVENCFLLTIFTWFLPKHYVYMFVYLFSLFLFYWPICCIVFLFSYSYYGIFSYFEKIFLWCLHLFHDLWIYYFFILYLFNFWFMFILKNKWFFLEHAYWILLLCKNKIAYFQFILKHIMTALGFRLAD